MSRDVRGGPHTKHTSGMLHACARRHSLVRLDRDPQVASAHHIIHLIRQMGSLYGGSPGNLSRPPPERCPPPPLGSPEGGFRSLHSSQRFAMSAASQSGSHIRALQSLVSSISSLESLLGSQHEGVPITRLRSLVSSGALSLSALKSHIRHSHDTFESASLLLAAQRRYVNDAQLDLDNKLFEKGHFARAVTTTLDFHSAVSDADVGLLDEEAFLATEKGAAAKKAAEEAARSAHGEEAEEARRHVIGLARHEFELAARKDLVQQRLTMQQEKLKLTAQIASEKSYHSTMDESLRAIHSASVPLQDTLAANGGTTVKQSKDAAAAAAAATTTTTTAMAGVLSTSAKRQRNSAVTSLPLPLYVAYSQLVALKEAIGMPSLSAIDIKGDADAAVAYARDALARAGNGDGAVGATAPAVDDEPEDEEAGTTRRPAKRAKSASAAAAGGTSLSDQDAGLDSMHPLRVCFTLSTGPSASLEISLAWCEQHGVAYAGIEGNPPNGARLLHAVFPGDVGAAYPLSSRATALPGLPPPGESRIGKSGYRPYHWAQHLCSLDVLPNLPVTIGADSPAAWDEAAATARRQRRAETIVAALTERVSAEGTLKSILAALAGGTVPPAAGDETLPDPRSQLRDFREVAGVDEEGGEDDADEDDEEMEEGEEEEGELLEDGEAPEPTPAADGEASAAAAAATKAAAPATARVGGEDGEDGEIDEDDGDEEMEGGEEEEGELLEDGEAPEPTPAAEGGASVAAAAAAAAKAAAATTRVTTRCFRARVVPPPQGLAALPELSISLSIPAEYPAMPPTLKLILTPPAQSISGSSTMMSQALLASFRDDVRQMALEANVQCVRDCTSDIDVQAVAQAKAEAAKAAELGLESWPAALASLQARMAAFAPPKDLLARQLAHVLRCFDVLSEDVARRAGGGRGLRRRGRERRLGFLDGEHR